MNKVYASSQYVVQNSEFVRINTKKLLEFCDNFTITSHEHRTTFLIFDFNSLTDEQKANFLFIWTSIGFSFWGEPKWEVYYNDKKSSGFIWLMDSLWRAIENWIPILDYNFLATISQEVMEQIFEGNTEIPMIQQRTSILKDIWNTVVTQCNGNIISLFDKEQSELELIEKIVALFPSFDDKTTYKWQEVYFNKRVQLFISDVFTVIDSKIHKITSINNISALADYKIPQVLRKLWILEYNQSLAEKVDNKIEILQFSNEEIEIRANMVVAIHKITEKLQDLHLSYRVSDIDDAVWLMWKKLLPGDFPNHRTRSIFY